MTLLNDHDAAIGTELPPKPVSATYQWIRSHHLFISWLEKGSNALLWLTGRPGSGKTILSYSLVQHFNDVRARSENILIYLCQNKNKPTDGRGILIGLMLQVIDCHRSIMHRTISELRLCRFWILILQAAATGYIFSAHVPLLR